MHKRAARGIILNMDAIFAACAALIGAMVGWAQFRLLQLAVLKGKTWLIAVKLPLWLAAMLAAAIVSIWSLAGFAAGATITFIALGVVRWREMRKGE